MELLIAFALVAVGLLAAAILFYRRRSEHDRRLGRRVKRRIDLFGEDRD